MKKHKRRLSFLDVGGIKPQPVPQDQTPVVDPEAERLERLKTNARRIMAEVQQAAAARVEARQRRIEQVRLKCHSGEWEQVENYVRTQGYRPEDIESGQAHEWALALVVNKRTYDDGLRR